MKLVTNPKITSMIMATVGVCALLARLFITLFTCGAFAQVAQVTTMIPIWNAKLFCVHSPLNQ